MRDGEIGGGTSGGDLVGQDVHHVPEALGGGRGRVGLHLAAQEPLQGTGVGELVEGAPGEHDGLVAVAQRHLALGRVVHAPPAVRVRGRDQRAALLVGERGQPGQPARGGLPEGLRHARVDGRGAQLGDQGGDRQRAARAAGDVLGLDTEFGEEAGRLVAVVRGGLHGGDDKAFTRARGGDVEQAAFLGEQGPRGERFGESVAADAVGLQEGAAAAQVRPQALLDARYDDQVPLQALGAVRGHQAYGVGAYGPPGERVGGDVLGVDLLQEVEGAPASGALLRAGGGREQRADGVQVAVRVAPGRSAAQCGPLQASGPRRALPEVPQRLLGRPAARQARPRALRSSAPRRWAPRAYVGSCATSRSGSASARVSSSSEGGGTGLPPARSSSRRARPRRRRSAASMAARGRRAG